MERILRLNNEDVCQLVAEKYADGDRDRVKMRYVSCAFEDGGSSYTGMMIEVTMDEES